MKNNNYDILGDVTDNYKSYVEFLKEQLGVVYVYGYTLSIKEFLNKHNFKIYNFIELQDYCSDNIRGFYLDSKNKIMGIVVTTYKPDFVK